MALRRTVFALLAVPFLSANALAGPGFEPIGLSASPIADFRLGSHEQTFGTLRFLGGLVVESDDARFGALSGLDVAPDGTLTAVADTGYWFSARLSEDGGRLSGIADGRMARILDDKGFPLVGKRASDAEGLRILGRDGREEAYVSFEQVNVVRRYRGPDYGKAKAEPVKVPLATAKLPRNEGLEAIAVAPADGPLGGALLLFAEHALNGDGNHRAFIVGGPRAGTFAIVRSDEFDVTDATFIPGGDLLILERRFSYASGVAMRLRRIAAGDIQPGATVDGAILLDANMRFQIDNMEGVAAHRGEDGETIVDIVSDDNKSIIQRTLILRFAMPGSPAAEAAAVASPADGMEPRATVDASLPVAAGPPLPRPRPSR